MVYGSRVKGIRFEGYGIRERGPPCRACSGVRGELDVGVVPLFVAVIDSGLGGVPREQKMLKGYLPRVIYHQVY